MASPKNSNKRFHCFYGAGDKVGNGVNVMLVRNFKQPFGFLRFVLFVCFN